MGEESEINALGEHKPTFYTGGTYNFVEFEKIWSNMLDKKDLTFDIDDLLSDEDEDDEEDDEVKATSNPCKDIIKKKYVPRKISAKK